MYICLFYLAVGIFTYSITDDFAPPSSLFLFSMQLISSGLIDKTVSVMLLSVRGFLWSALFL